MNSKKTALLLPCVLALTMLLSWLGLSGLDAAAPLSPSATFNVNSTTDATDANPGNGICETASGNGVCTLRAAIQEANALAGADTINIPSGTFVMTINGLNEDNAATGDFDIKDDLVINGAGLENTIIDGNGLDRLFHITGTIGTTVQMTQLTIQHGNSFHPQSGYEGKAGCVLNDTGILDIQETLLYDNDYGCLYNTGVMTVTNSLVQDNSEIAINNLAPGKLLVTNSVITNNYIGINNDDTAIVSDTTVSESDTGIRSKGFITISATAVISNNSGISNRGEMSVLNSTVSHNFEFSGIYQGDGPNTVSSYIYNTDISYNYYSGIWLDSGSLYVLESDIHHNVAPARGGGVFADNVLTVTIHASSIHHNTIAEPANGCGGGINFSGKAFRLSSSVIHSNTVQFAPGMAGGLCISTWTLVPASVIINSTISNNSAIDTGGIFFTGPLLITNTTVYGNEGTTIGGLSASTNSSVTINNSVIANNVGGNCSGTGIVSGGHNLDSGISCNFTNMGDLSNTAPLLGPLQDNGGPTWTHALLTDSPAIDAGDNVSCPATDQRGYMRPQDGDDDNNPVCDIGAYELGTHYLINAYLPLLQK